MTSEDLIAYWPDAPTDERPKNLFIDQPLDAGSRAMLLERGWKVYDVRALPNKTDADRAEGLKAVLEGVRIGSIEPDKTRLRWLELEAKVYGLLTGKDKLADTTPNISEEVLENLLDFGEKKVKMR